MKYPERVIVGAIRRGIEVSKFGHFRLKAKVGLHFKNCEFMYVKGVKSDLFVDFQINFFGCDCVAPGICQCTSIELLQTTNVCVTLFCFERFWYLNYSIQ